MSTEIHGLPYQFSRPELLGEALTHRSAGRPNNERLEFLGDAILNCVIAEALYHQVPEADEGALSRLRALLVRGETLAQIAGELNLGEALALGSGELKSGGFRRRSILADALEAVIGAVYLDGGFEACRGLIRELFASRLESLPAAESLKDPKTRLQEYLQARQAPLPVYRLVAEQGEPHRRTFRVACEIPWLERPLEASGRSRRAAEQEAARLVLQELEES